MVVKMLEGWQGTINSYRQDSENPIVVVNFKDLLSKKETAKFSVYCLLPDKTYKIDGLIYFHLCTSEAILAPYYEANTKQRKILVQKNQGVFEWTHMWKYKTWKGPSKTLEHKQNIEV